MCIHLRTFDLHPILILEVLIAHTYYDITMLEGIPPAPLSAAAARGREPATRRAARHDDAARLRRTQQGEESERGARPLFHTQSHCWYRSRHRGRRRYR